MTIDDGDLLVADDPNGTLFFRVRSGRQAQDHLGRTAHSSNAPAPKASTLSTTSMASSGHTHFK